MLRSQEIFKLFIGVNALIFYRPRDYISACQKQPAPAPEALRMLFQGQLPAFIH